MNNSASWIILILLAIGVMWYSQREAIQQQSLFVSPFNYPVIPTPSTAVFSELTDEMSAAPVSTEQSDPERFSELRGMVELLPGRARSLNPDDEFVEIKISKDAPAPVVITGWILENSSGLRVAIGGGAPVLFPQPTVPSLQPIALDPGASAVITTGQSSGDADFRVNKCTGYLDQANRFSHSLPRACPLIRDEVSSRDRLPERCIDYVETIGQCQIPPAIPETLSEDCAQFVREHANYRGCFMRYRANDDFLGGTWRIFLKRNQELWKQRRETITLRDEQGKVVSELTY